MRVCAFAAASVAARWASLLSGMAWNQSLASSVAYATLTV